jgi:2-methylcitrate dehydratase PrpD
MNASAELASFAASLRFEDIPEPVVRRAEDLLVDWFASALAGKGARRSRPSCASRRRWVRPREPAR